MAFYDFGKKSRAQLFSMDLLIALAVLSAVVGFALQSAEFSSRSLSGRAELLSNSADALAESNVSGRVLDGFSFPSCAVLKNTTRVLSDNCTPSDFNRQQCAVAGKRGVFVARRIAKCPGSASACLLEVRTCE